MLCIVLHEIEESALAAALRRDDFNLVARAFRQCLLQKFAILKIRRDVNRFRQILRLQIELLQERRHELLRIKLFQLFPVEFAAIDDAASAQVE